MNLPLEYSLTSRPSNGVITASSFAVRPTLSPTTPETSPYMKLKPSPPYPPPTNNSNDTRQLQSAGQGGGSSRTAHPEMLLSDPDAFKTVNFKTPPSTTALPPSCRPSGELEKLACTPMVDAKGVRFAIGGVVHRISVVVTWVAARMVESPYLQLNWEKSWKPCP